MQQRNGSTCTTVPHLDADDAVSPTQHDQQTDWVDFNNSDEEMACMKPCHCARNNNELEALFLEVKKKKEKLPKVLSMESSSP